MTARIVRIARALGLALVLSATLATGAMAECNGPACGPPETGVVGIEAMVLIAILVVFGAVMAAAEVRRSRD